jgi:hypothetical protein
VIDLDCVLVTVSSAYVQQWTSNVQYQLGNAVLQAAYVGTHGLKLLFGSTFERNQLDMACLALGNQTAATGRQSVPGCYHERRAFRSDDPVRPTSAAVPGVHGCRKCPAAVRIEQL